VIAKGILDKPDINALAARNHNSLTMMVWNYHDDDILGEVATIALAIKGLNNGRVLMQHYRVDQQFSNSYKKWADLGKPQTVSNEQYTQIEQAGQLELYTSPEWIDVENGETLLRFSIPRQGVSLIKLEW
jgi:xylan 1,4-beta-xylosidase